jgi:hypothetical protein
LNNDGEKGGILNGFASQPVDLVVYSLKMQNLF